MKKITVILDDTLEKIVEKDSLANRLTVSETVRRRLTEAYHSQAKQEEKLVKTFDIFESKVLKILEDKFEKVDAQNVRNLIYVLTNHHLLKLILKDSVLKDLDIDEQAIKIREYVSLAKGLGLKAHPVDSFHSKENLTANIQSEHMD